MTDLTESHSEAMDLAEKAVFARARGQSVTAARLLNRAFKKEEHAALLAVRGGAPEPTRAILLKSAAHLAVDIGETRRAEQLVGLALAGDPPEELAQELRALLEEIGFQRHLEVRGVELQDNDLQMVLVGDAVSPGMIAADEFVRRIEIMQSLIYRTSEFDRGMDYRERGDPKQGIEQSLQMYVSTPRAASFAVSLKVAGLKGQGEFEFSESSVVLEHLLDRLELYEQSNYDALREVITHSDYLENFISLASRLAPDGRAVKMVGLTAWRGGNDRRLALRRAPRTEGSLVENDESVQPRRFVGRLFYFKEDNEGAFTLKLRTDDGNEFRLKGSGELLDKAVKYVGRKSAVTVKGTRSSKSTLLFDDIFATRAGKASRTKSSSKKKKKKR